MKLSNAMTLYLPPGKFLLNGEHHFVKTFTIGSAKMVSASIRCMSLANKSDRVKIRSVANALNKLCDKAEL